MSDITRVSLPEEFYDITSAQLLVTPQPQFLYAQMFMAAVGAQFPSGAGMVGMQGREVGGSGPAYAKWERDQLMLSNPLMSGVFAATVNFDGMPGDVVRFNRPSYASTTYTQASREVLANSTISTTTINAGSEQTSLVLKRFAGPYDSTNSRVAPYGLDRFHANMGVHDLATFVGTHLSEDFHRFIDAVNVSLLDQASTVVRPQGMSADTDATSAGMFPMDYDTVNRAELEADNANLPVFSDGFRILVLTPTQISQLKTDADYIELSEAHKEYNALFPQYVASVGKLHIFKSTTLNSDDNASSVAIHKGHLIAPGALLGGLGKAPRIASSTDDNYGEVAKAIWMAYLAFGVADDRFCISVRSSE